MTSTRRTHLAWSNLGRAAVLAGTGLSLVAWILAHRWLGVVALIPWAALALDALAARPIDLRARRTSSVSRSLAGLRVPSHIELVHGGWLPRRIVLEDPVDPPGGQPRTDRRQCRLTARSRVGVERSISLETPGGYRLGPLTARLPGPLGLLERHAVLEDQPARLDAIPRPDRPDRASTGSGRRLAAQAASQRPGQDEGFHRLRPYRPGDRIRDINWKKTQAALARGPDQPPIVTVRTDTSNDPLVLLADVRAITGWGREGGTAFASTLRTVAGYSDEMLAQRPVGLVLLGSGAACIQPGTGRAHRDKVLHQLARCRPSGQTTLSDAMGTVARMRARDADILYVGCLAADPDLPAAIDDLAGRRSHLWVHEIPLPRDPDDAEVPAAGHATLLSHQQAWCREELETRGHEILP